MLFVGLRAEPHTRGVSMQFQDQINPQNLISATAEYVTANSTRDNNTQMFNSGGARADAAVLVNAADPYGGYCYGPAGKLQTCAKGGRRLMDNVEPAKLG